MVSYPCIPNKFSEEKIVNVAEVNQLHCLEESGQRLENVDQTHLVLAGGKMYCKKICIDWISTNDLLS